MKRRGVRACSRIAGGALVVLAWASCSDWVPHADLAPDYRPAQFVVPASWRGASPFVEAKPSDGEVRPDWWTLYQDPLLNKLEAQAMAANPDLQAAAERFVQARDIMMKVRSRRMPQLGMGFGASNNRQSPDTLFRAPDSPITESDGSLPGSRTSGRPSATRRGWRSIAPSNGPPSTVWHDSASRRNWPRIISRCVASTPRTRSTRNPSISTGIRWIS